MLRYRTKLDLV